MIRLLCAFFLFGFVHFAGAADMGNSSCPVSGDKIKNLSKAIKQEYNGNTYNLCCKMCMKDFAKDPAKYEKIAVDSMNTPS